MQFNNDFVLPNIWITIHFFVGESLSLSFVFSPNDWHISVNTSKILRISFLEQTLKERRLLFGRYFCFLNCIFLFHSPIFAIFTFNVLFFVSLLNLFDLFLFYWLKLVRRRGMIYWWSAERNSERPAALSGECPRLEHRPCSLLPRPK